MAGKALSLASRTLIWTASCVASVTAHGIVVTSIAVAAFFGLLVPVDFPFAAQLNNPMFRPRGEEWESGVVVIEPGRRPRPVPSLELPETPQWESARIPETPHLGPPASVHGGFERDTPDRGHWFRARGDSADFVSDKGYKGLGTYDVVGSFGGGGGRYGVATRGRDAVHRALGWMMRHRTSDGAWRECRECAIPRASVGNAALAALAVLGAGYLPDDRTTWDGMAFGDVVRTSLEMAAAEPKPATGPEELALVALALCEAQRLTKGKWGGVAKTALERALREAPGEPWTAIAVKSGMLAGVSVPAGAEDRALKWFDQRTPWAAELDVEDIRERWTGLLRWLHHEGMDNRWKRLSATTKAALLRSQESDGASCASGSWAPFQERDRFASTAICVVCLELFPVYLQTFGPATLSWK